MPKKAAPRAPAQGLVIRKLADHSVGGTRVRGIDPDTGQAALINPATGRAEPWPLLGVVIQGEPPERCTVSTKLVEKGMSEGWIALEGARGLTRPGGSMVQPWAKSYSFVHADAIVFHCVGGDVRYRVTHQPDKYADPGDDDEPVTPDAYSAGQTRVDMFYGLELEG